MRSEILRDAESFSGLFAEWTALWRASTTRPLTLHPAWLAGWWRTLGGDGELSLVTVRDGVELRGLSPLYLRAPRGGALRVRELSLAGEGVVGGQYAVLTRAGDEDLVMDAVVDAVAADRGWDLFDVSLVGEQHAAALARRFVERGRRVEQDPLVGRPQLGLPWQLVPAVDAAAQSLTVLECDPARFSAVLTALAELSSRGPERRAGEPGFVRFLERVAPALAADSLARLWMVEAPTASAASAASARTGGRLLAANLVLTDGDRSVELVRAVAPGWSKAGDALLAHSIAAVTSHGSRSFELADETLVAATERVRGVRLRVFGGSAAAVITAGYSSIERRAGAVADAARGEIDRIRHATSDIVERAVARVATFSKLHLYRGELFVRNAPPPPGVTLCLFSLSDFDALADRGAFLRRLDLDEAYCRQKWERGDLVVLANLDGDPAGIVWCARYAVYVPEIGREVRPLGGECYIHDVYVTPPARGRAVAPAMLEFLSRELRGRDVYRAWALIERSNTSSTRAFEKASYASVADVVYARMGLASKLLVRPPDPEARKFLGLK